MKPLTPLAAAFTVLAALVVWREATRGSSKSLSEEAALKPLQVRPFTVDDVSKVEVTAPGGDKPAYTLAHENKSWRVHGAFTAPAAGAKMVELLNSLGKVEGEFRSDDKAALEQFDLTPLRSVRVRVLDGEGKELAHLAIGRTSGSRGAFVSDLASGADESKAYALTADVRGLFGLSHTSAGDHEPDKPEPSAFYEKEFPQFALDKAKHVQFDAPGRVVAFDMVKKDDKDTKGEWKLASGGPDAPVKKEGVESALKSFGGGLRPSGLVDPAKKKDVGLESPKYRLAVTNDDGTTRVVVGTSDDEAKHFYVHLDVTQDPDVVYEASEYDFHQMFPSGGTLFDLPKIETGKDGPTRVVVEKKGRDTIEVTRKGTKPADDWTLASPKWPLDAKQSSLRSLGSSLPSIRVSDYVDDVKAPEADVTVRFGAADAPDDKLQTLVIGGKSPSGKDRLAVLPGKPGHVFVVAENGIDRVAPELLSLFETKVLHGWSRDDVTAARVADGPAVTHGGDDTWKVETGADRANADKSAVESWLDKLLALEWTGVNAAAKDEKFVAVTVERKDGAPVTIDLGPAADGRRTLKIGEFRGTVSDAPGLVPDAAALTLKAVEAPKKDDEKK